jgi:2-polyprenyl-6-methoxyphenol hydroxylase-like FAD-dependent oxidoreductase
MRAAVIGAGPTGLVLGTALAQRGYDVTIVDRDPGPGPDGAWPRQGVMQFHHAHAFRPQVVDIVRQLLPDAYQSWLAAGAEPVDFTWPDGRLGQLMRSRRRTFEEALRQAVVRQPGVEVRRGHVDSVVARHGRVAGVVVDGAVLEADLVVDASGRSGRVTRELRAPAAVGGRCGIAYVDRQYQLVPGAEWGPLISPIAWQGDYDGYLVIIFVHERGIFSVLIARPDDDPDLRLLRHDHVFDEACRAIPDLATWTDPQRARPVTRVLPGGAMLNHYRSQRGPDGRPALPGLVFVGDAVCTTTPNFGRGITTGMMQVRELLRLVDASTDDLEEEFDAWCEANMRPWVEDHVHMDEASLRRWRGADLDLDERLPSDLIMAASQFGPEVQARIGPAAGAYLGMTALPSCLDPVEPVAREVYRSGWRAPYTPGPTRAELAALCRDVARDAVPV